MDRDSATCLLLFESLGFPSCCHFVFPVGLSWGVWYCCFQNAYLEASLYVLEHTGWLPSKHSGNNSTKLPMISPQETQNDNRKGSPGSQTAKGKWQNHDP